MKKQLQPRPQSRNFRTNAPKTARGSLLINREQAQEKFKEAKQQQQSKNYQKALQLYLRSTIYDPRYYQAYCNIGSIYRHMGRYSESKSSYLKAIQIKPEDAISHYNLANVLRILGNTEESIRHYDYVISLKEEKNQNINSLYINSLINIAICYKNKELYEKAEFYCDKAYKIDTNDQVVLFNYGMIVMLMINQLEGDSFNEVKKERARKAKQLFQLLLKLNPSNELAQINLIKIDAILNKNMDKSNLNQCLKKLKQILPNSSFKEEINQALGYITKLLQQYEASATYYSRSFRDNKKEKRAEVAVNNYDEQVTKAKKVQTFTEEEAMKMIAEERIDEVMLKIKLMKDSQLSKHVIEMAVHLHEFETKEGQHHHYNSAVNIYNKYFIKNSKEIPDEELSIEAHKVLGKYLSMQKKYKQSIRHFEYISNKINSQEQKSKIHSQLGDDYQKLGDRQKALEEYKIALQAEPNNYQMIYNIGCFLAEGGHDEESLKYFNSFLQKIQTNHEINMATRALYKADCLVTMSSSLYNKPNQFQIYEKATKAIKEMQSQSQNGLNIQFENEKLLNFYLRWADLLQQKLSKISDRKSQQYLSCKQNLLNTYISLLENELCPDRNAILSNCATIYYEEKLFMNCLSFLSQITQVTAQTYNNLALTYLNLGQHFMATQNIYKAYQEDVLDPLIICNKQVFDWIYAIQKTQWIYSRYPNTAENSMFYRWQYGLILLDAFTKKINQTQSSLNLQQTQKIINSLLEYENLVALLDETQVKKLKIILSHISKAQAQQSWSIEEELLKLCLSKSTNLKNDIIKILKFNQQSKNRSLGAKQILLFLFIFANKDQQSTIKSIFQSYVQNKQASFELNMDKKVKFNHQQLQKTMNIINFDSLVLSLLEWQCEIQPNQLVLVKFIEKCFYNSKDAEKLEIQHNFPRHSSYFECSATLQRLLRIIYKQFPITCHSNIVSTKRIHEMKQQILIYSEKSFDNLFRNTSQTHLKLSQNFIPISIYAYFKNKEASIEFITQLKKQSSSKIQVEKMGKNNQEIVIIISKIIKLYVRWQNEEKYHMSLASITTSPLTLFNQSILQISQGLQTLIEANPQFKDAFSRIEAFK